MKLGCAVEVNVTDKLRVVEKWRKEMGLCWKEVAFLGQSLVQLETLVGILTTLPYLGAVSCHYPLDWFHGHVLHCWRECICNIGVEGKNSAFGG